MLTPACLRADGNYVTGAGGLLSCVMLGLTGIRIGGDPRSAAGGNATDPLAAWASWPAALPEGWESISIERMYVQGVAMGVEARHGERAVLAPWRNRVGVNT